MYLLMFLLSSLVKLVLYGLLIAVGWWVYRRVRLRSLPWLGLYLLLSIPVSFLLPLLTQRVINTAGDGQLPPQGWTMGTLVTTWISFNAVVDGLINILLAVLILSDIAFLVSTTGVPLTPRPVQQLVHLRAYSTRIGVTIALLVLVAPLILVVVWARTIS